MRSPDINYVLIAGNLTRDPTLRRTNNGTPVANFTIVSNKRYRDNMGQWREEVCHVGVVAWYRLAEICHNTLKKGMTVLVDGELQSRSLKTASGWSQNVVEIRARRVQVLNGYTSRSARAAAPKSAEDAEAPAEKAAPPSEEITEHPPAENLENPPGNSEPIENNEFDFGYRNLEL